MRLGDVARGVGVEHLLELRQHQARPCARRRGSASADGNRRSSASTRLAMFLARSPMRSRSLAMRSAPTISRRSIAIGWRRAIVRIAFSSISRCSASICASAAIDSLGELDVALGQRIDRRRRPASRRGRPSRRPCGSSSCRSSSKALTICSGIIVVLAVVAGFAAQPKRPVM